MFWDHYRMGWSWIWVLVAVLLIASIIVLVILLATRATSSPPHPPTEHRGPLPGRSNARAIAEERLARGEITPDEYREIRRALDETAPPGG